MASQLDDALLKAIAGTTLGGQIMKEQADRLKESGRKPQPPRVTVYDTVTGNPVQLFRIDAADRLRRGDAVDHPSKARQVNPQAEAIADVMVEALTEDALSRLEIPQLRELWTKLHDGDTPNPRLGQKRLISEILAAYTAKEEEGGGDGTAAAGESEGAGG